MNYVICPIAHGVEVKPVKQNYAQPLIDKIKGYLTDEEKDFFVPIPYNYSIQSNERQIEMFTAVESGLGNSELRRLKHTIGSDVTWSFIRAKDGNDVYSVFCSDMTELIESARKKYPDAKVVCIGHSEGTQNLFSFFFDYPGTIDGFISMGSPIAMNSGAYIDWGKCPPNLGWWVNFYHDKDFISSRFQGCHPSRAISGFVVDYGVPQGWNPIYHVPMLKVQLVAGLLAHVSYWTSDFVAEKIAELIKKEIHSTGLDKNTGNLVE